MASTPDGISFQTPKIRNLRWWIGGLLFASTVINYIDRQTLSLLAPYLKHDFHWTNTDYANVLIAFRIAYTFGQSICGRFIDKIGTRRGLTLSVIWYSIASICTSFARGLSSFAFVRFLLGVGESANWPGATKAVSEWFPKRDRALAAALFDSGSSIGGAIAPFLILPIYFRWGLRPAFVIPGLLGFVWLIVWRRFFFLPQDHPRITAGEREMILSENVASDDADARPASRWRDLLKLPQTWGTIVSKALTDPVWFFVADWFPTYLGTKGGLDCDLGSFHCGRSREFFWRSGVWILNPARLVAWRGSEGGGRVRWIRRDVVDPDDFDGKPCCHHGSFCAGDILLRGLFDDRECAAVGFVYERVCRVGERNERDGGGNRNDYRI